MPLLEFGPQIKDVRAGSHPAAAAAGIPSPLMPQPAGCIDTFSRTVLPGAWGTGEWALPWAIIVTHGSGAGNDALAPNHYRVAGGYGLFDMNGGFGEPIFTTTAAEVDRAWTLPAEMEVRGQIRDHGGYADLRDGDWLLCSTPIDRSGRYQRLYTWSFGAYHLVYYAAAGVPNSGSATWQAWLVTNTATLHTQYGTGTAYSDAGPDATLINSWAVEMSTVSSRYCVTLTGYMGIDLSLHTASPTSSWGGYLGINSTGVFARAWGPDGISPTISIAGSPAAPTSLKFTPVKELDMVIGTDVVRTSGDCGGTSGIWARLDDPRFNAVPVEYDLGLGNGSTTLFTVTPAPYIPGSLRVWVDGLEQTYQTTETSPAAGTFTLGFAPLASERIRVWYQNG